MRRANLVYAATLLVLLVLFVAVSGDAFGRLGSWQAAIDRGLIEGDAGYYESGEASAREYGHAAMVAVLEVERRLADLEEQWQNIGTTGSGSVGTTPSSTTTAPASTSSSVPQTSSSQAPTTTSTSPSTTATSSTLASTSSTTSTPTTTTIGSPVTTAPSTSTLVTIPTGVHSGASFEVESDTHYFCQDGAVLDGGGVETAAFYGTADNVTIEGCEVRNYANPAQRGAIRADGNRWVVVDNEVHHNWGVGIEVDGVGHYVGGNNVHHQHQLGLAASGVDIVIEANEIAWNNYEVDFDWGWEAGGTKFWATDGLVVRGNYSHDNHGPGLWDDYNNINVLYEGNLVEDNYGPGIFHEIGYAAVIRNNEVRGNGFGHAAWLWGAGIVIASSTDTEVYGNIVEGNFNGISLVEQDRNESVDWTDDPDEVVTWRTERNVVHGNLVIDSGLSGAVADNGWTEVFDRNEFYGNIYEGDVGWSWGGIVSWDEWVAIHPGEAT